MKHYHGYLSATAPLTNTKYKRRLNPWQKGDSHDNISLNRHPIKGFWWWFINSMATYQPQLHLPTTNTKGGWSYDKKVIATTKYHWIDIQLKDFDGSLSIPTMKRLNKNLWNTTMVWVYTRYILCMYIKQVNKLNNQN
jgi:hypothetical protein